MRLRVSFWSLWSIVIRSCEGKGEGEGGEKWNESEEGGVEVDDNILAMDAESGDKVWDSMISYEYEYLVHQKLVMGVITNLGAFLYISK